jgi:hypothetical protein
MIKNAGFSELHSDIPILVSFLSGSLVGIKDLSNL